jgi:hypothetical protein
MTTTILEKDYVEQERPYSLKELKNTRTNLYNTLRLGNTKANHQRCGHFYFVKENGRKEKEMYEQDSDDIGNCSVCWKLSKVEKFLKNRSQNLVEAYSNEFYNEPKYITYDNLDLETVFYKWLYEDNNGKDSKTYRKSYKSG